MPISRPASFNGDHYTLALLSAFAAAFFGAACQSGPAPSAAAVSADTWAIVDGREITRSDVESAYRRAQPPSQSISEEEALTAKLSLLNELIVQDLLLAKARALNIVVADTELESEYAEARKNLPEEAFQQELKQRNLTSTDIREGLRRELLAQKVIEREVSSKVTVTDQEVKDFFEANRSQFNLPEDGYHVAQIAVTPVRDAQITNRTGDDATTPAAAAEKVKRLMERLKAGAPFGDVAMDYSEDTQSAPRGGDMGLVPVSTLRGVPPPLRDAVMKASPGSVNVVTVGGVHHIVLLLTHEKAGQRDPSMPAVRERITANLRGRREQLLRAAYLTTLRSDAQVVNHLARRLVESQGKTPGPAPAQR